MLPTAGLRDHVTAAFELFSTVAAKFCFSDAPRLTLSGVTDTLTAGVSETLALADFVGLATLVAVTVTV
jgi:hypothetical protein